MPKVAVLSDIHGNLPAFESVLKQVDKHSVDLIVFGGDIVGYGASPAKCVEYVRALGGNCVFGNHESYTVAVADNGVESLGDWWSEDPVEAGAVHAFRSLSEDALDWIRGLPWFLPLDEDVIIAHAGLDDPNSWPYLECDETAAPTIEIMKNRDLKIGFFGHIHKLAVFPEREPSRGGGFYELKDAEPTAITVGSVGQPRDKDGRASWVLFDSDERTVEFLRTEYDRELAARQIIDAGLPARSGERLLRR